MARQLKTAGWSGARPLKGGWIAWRAAGLEDESKPAELLDF